MDEDQKETDSQFMKRILEQSHWLFYGELDYHLLNFLKQLFSHDDKILGYDKYEGVDAYFWLAYWCVISELNALKLIDYGVSPRYPWLTEDGERFKSIIKQIDKLDTQDYLTS